ncbi:MAG: hypothetical protein ACFFEF_00840 [Candidatus Thorarchaeota archaeon]
MESNDMGIGNDFDITTVGYLLGELGIEILTMIAQGCSNDSEIKRLSTITSSCLDIKIPLLETLGLIRIEGDIYILTKNGVTVLKELTGWRE